MSSVKLKEDLSNCLINFDRRVLITELLDDYKLSYEEVNKIIENYLNEQEKKEKIKFEKRYLIYGLQGGDMQKEIYKIVEETKLKEWLKILKCTESSLYSVEVAGGAKAAAPVFKPMKVEECVKSNDRQVSKTSSANDVEISISSGNKKDLQHVKNKGDIKKETPTEPLKPTAIMEPSVKISPKKETTSKEIKIVDKKSAIKKGINNFFTPSAVDPKKPDSNKDYKNASSDKVIKPNTSKKMDDFFKKQQETPKINTNNSKEKAANTSLQLFHSEEITDESSSDEEEKLDALKRDIISSDVELEPENLDKESISGKRRRILDSDDEEDPPVKQEKIEIKEETEEEEAAPETYLDEDGFVITKKPKQKPTSGIKKSPSITKMPPVTIKNSPKEANNSTTNLNKDTKAAIKSLPKTKQSGIRNFFSKK